MLPQPLLGGLEHQQRELHFLVDHTEPDLVSLTLDVGWVHRAGGQPAQVVQQFYPRIRVLHFKDFKVKNAQQDTWTELGQGYVDFPSIVEAMPYNADLWITVERDEVMPNAAESARISAEYLKKLLSSKGKNQ